MTNETNGEIVAWHDDGYSRSGSARDVALCLINLVEERQGSVLPRLHQHLRGIAENWHLHLHGDKRRRHLVE